MKKLLIIALIIFMWAIPAIADVKYPSEQMINRCFPIGQNVWESKKQIAQLSLDYNWTFIWYDWRDEFGSGIRLYKDIDNNDQYRTLEIIIYFNKNNVVCHRSYLIARMIGLMEGYE
jgi:hypothetical protein